MVGWGSGVDPKNGPLTGQRALTRGVGLGGRGKELPLHGLCNHACWAGAWQGSGSQQKEGSKVITRGANMGDVRGETHGSHQVGEHR